MNLPDIVETTYKNGYKDGVKDIKQAIRELIDTEFKAGAIRCINCGEVMITVYSGQNGFSNQFYISFTREAFGQSYGWVHIVNYHEIECLRSKDHFIELLTHRVMEELSDEKIRASMIKSMANTET